jgi:FkbM family methyltransferase
VILDRLLVAYSYFPNHPGKGLIYDQLMPFVKGGWKAPRVRARYGVRFECDLKDKVTREIYYTGFSNRDCRILKGLVKPGQVILDAGANVGYFSLLCAKWLRGRGTVHSFEPFPETGQRFERNLELNPAIRQLVHIHRVALSDSTGTMGMTVPDEGNKGCNFLSSSGTVRVDATTLDSFCKEERLTRVDLVKVDVEGSELALVRGAEQSIRRFRPILMIEVNPSALARFGQTAAGLIEAICRLRYRLHYAGRFGLRLLQRLPTIGEEPNIFAFPID